MLTNEKTSRQQRHEDSPDRQTARLSGREEQNVKSATRSCYDGLRPPRWTSDSEPPFIDDVEWSGSATRNSWPGLGYTSRASVQPPSVTVPPSATIFAMSGERIWPVKNCDSYTRN